MPINEIFVATPDCHLPFRSVTKNCSFKFYKLSITIFSSVHQHKEYLSTNSDFVVSFISNRALILVLVAKNHGDCRSSNTSLPLLVDKFLKGAGSNLFWRWKYYYDEIRKPKNISDLLQSWNAENKTNRIQNVGFTTAVQSRDCIEHGIKAVNDCPFCIWLQVIPPKNIQK